MAEFHVGDRVTAPPGDMVYRIESLREEEFARGGVQQVANLRSRRGEASSMRVAHLRTAQPDRRHHEPQT